ncbi:MAG: hypothetical protein KatS3mg083_117 [Candidatus Dojkabacteria bacterium]|nr:MAG: hypothetical protein KatS3mg083_117 [Candidatus Dojkabacteria bacterium]
MKVYQVIKIIRHRLDESGSEYYTDEYLMNVVQLAMDGMIAEYIAKNKKEYLRNFYKNISVNLVYVDPINGFDFMNLFGYKHIRVYNACIVAGYERLLYRLRYLSPEEYFL